MKKSLTKSIQIPLLSRMSLLSPPPRAAVLSNVKSAFLDLCALTGQEVLAAIVKALRVQLCEREAPA